MPTPEETYNELAMDEWLDANRDLANRIREYIADYGSDAFEELLEDVRQP